MSILNKLTAQDLCDRLNPNTVVNVGAFDCADAIVFAKNGAKVYAFEPMDIKIGSHENITLYPFALTDVDGFVDFYPSDNGCSGSIHAPKNHLRIWKNVNFSKPIKVNSMRLDSWNNTDEIDLIYADVNGGEAEFIQGAQETLKRTKWMLLEVSNYELYEGQKKVNSIVKMLKGWRVHGVYNDYKRFCDILLKNEQFYKNNGI